MSEVKKPTPPYVSYATFKNKVREFADHSPFPSQIDPSVLSGMAGSTQAQFLVALRYFGLIGDKGKPTDIIRGLARADDTQWKSEIGRLLQSHYPRQLEVLAHSSPKALRDSFVEEYSSAEGSVLDKSIRFLIAAATDAGLPISSVIRDKPRVSNSRTRKSVTRKSPTTDLPAESPNQTSPTASTRANADPWLSKYPDFDPSWPKEIQTQWFDGFQRLMGMKEGGKHG